MLTQLCEKLDAVREVAGKCLVRLLSDQEGSLMHICDLPDREVLMDSLVATNSCGNANEAVNWAHPAHVFPRLLPILSSSVYFGAVVNGLVIAIGGLSETVVKEYEDSIAVHQDGFHTTINETRAESLISLMKEHSGDDRVVVPLLKTLLLLLRNGAFENSVFEHPGPRRHKQQ